MPLQPKNCHLCQKLRAASENPDACCSVHETNANPKIAERAETLDAGPFRPLLFGYDPNAKVPRFDEETGKRLNPSGESILAVLRRERSELLASSPVDRRRRYRRGTSGSLRRLGGSE